jgi:peptidoglycan L-alanyl-D-glutamate endopeptidase CwlK
MNHNIRAIKEVQSRLKDAGFYAGKIDGLIGPISRAAARVWVSSAKEADLDDRSRVHIHGGKWNGAEIHPLHKRLQPMAERHIRLLRSLMNAAIISGHRTFAQQSTLYEQGRSKPGKIVTNARAGHSNHNFALAYDIGIFAEGKYLGSSGLYSLAGEIGKQLDLVWGGDWRSFVDPPHFEFPHKTNLATLRARVAAGQDVLG